MAVYVCYATTFSGQIADTLLSATIYDLWCSKTLLPWTIFELGDKRMSLREFFHHIATSRFVLQEDSFDHELKKPKLAGPRTPLTPSAILVKGFVILVWECICFNIELYSWKFRRVIAISVLTLWPEGWGRESQGTWLTSSLICWYFQVWFVCVC